MNPKETHYFLLAVSVSDDPEKEPTFFMAKKENFAVHQGSKKHLMEEYDSDSVIEILKHVSTLASLSEKEKKYGRHWKSVCCTALTRHCSHTAHSLLTDSLDLTRRDLTKHCSLTAHSLLIVAHGAPQVPDIQKNEVLLTWTPGVTEQGGGTKRTILKSDPAETRPEGVQKRTKPDIVGMGSGRAKGVKLMETSRQMPPPQQALNRTTDHDEAMARMMKRMDQQAQEYKSVTKENERIRQELEKLRR